MDPMQILQQQIEEARRRADRRLEAESLSTLGDLHFEAQRWPESQRAYEESLEVFRQEGNEARLAGVQVRLADVHAAQKEWDQAIDLCNQARALLEHIQDDEGLARVYTNLGILHWQKGEWRKAIDCYQKRLEIVERLGDPKEISNVSANLGMLYQAVGHREKAAQLMARAFLVAHQAGLEMLIDRAGTQLTNIFGHVFPANAYLREIAGANAPQIEREPQDEQGRALAQLFADVQEALDGDRELARQLRRHTGDVANDPKQPEDTRELARVLHRVLNGEREPDLSSLPETVAGPLQEWLGRLDKRY